MKEIVSIYKRSVDTNLKDISSILKKLDIKNPEDKKTLLTPLLHYCISLAYSSRVKKNLVNRAIQKFSEWPFLLIKKSTQINVIDFLSNNVILK